MHFPPILRRALLGWCCVGAAALTLAPTVTAQARQLSWPEITVRARLDADGRLYVTERQVIRFTGDWNGGYRVFDLRPGQSFEFDGIRREDPATGASQSMIEGDLDVFNGYDFTDSRTLRWRSRLPTDPPFDHTDIAYVLEFHYEDVLQPGDDGTYVLDHDFAIADREGMVDRFAVSLEVDPAWRVPDDFRGEWQATNLAPGQNFVVTVPLTRVAVGRPAAVHFGTPPVVRHALLATLAVALVALFVRLRSRERRLGRMVPLDPGQQIDRRWLQEHVFSDLPEVIGAAWDDATAAPEVAATLARLVQEGRMSSRVETKGAWIFTSHVLHLRLLVPRSSFSSHERALVDALFDPGATETSTERVQERYKKTGFDPASVIRDHLTKRARVMMPRSTEVRPSRVPTPVMMAIAVILVIAGVIAHPPDAPFAAIVIFGSLPLYFIAIAFAHTWRRNVATSTRGAVGFLLPLGLIAGGFGWFMLYEGRFRLGAMALAGLTLWIIALAHSVFNWARSRESAERIARRRQLAAAREYFRRELRKEQPALHDNWFPYVLAFGLGRHIDRWFEAFGSAATAAGRSAAYSSGMAGASGGSSGGPSWTGFGGGGGFGGAGGGASFGAALGAMASSVPSPSSGGSGGGGGGGGGGSSGGGGGGGW